MRLLECLHCVCEGLEIFSIAGCFWAAKFKKLFNYLGTFNQLVVTLSNLNKRKLLFACRSVKNRQLFLKPNLSSLLIFNCRTLDDLVAFVVNLLIEIEWSDKWESW